MLVVTVPVGDDTKLGRADGGATLDSKLPALAALLCGSNVELLRGSTDIKTGCQFSRLNLCIK
jgi:hypothetical protein